MQFDYTTVGHVTIDVLDDGMRRPGGTAFYSALQASRLGLRTRIVTRGLGEEIEALLAPYRDELELEVMPAESTTTLLTRGEGTARSQLLLAWAGPIEEDLELRTAILHLAPVARELPQRWRAGSAFVGLTPQGLLRSWGEPGGELSLAHGPAGAEPAHAELAGRCDALVLSEGERRSAAGLMAAASAAGALVAVTAGPLPTVLHRPDGMTLEVAVPPLPAGPPGADLGAGDVFAAALFVMLAEGAPAERAAAFANAAAAVRMAAAEPSAIGDRDSIAARLREGT